MPNLIRKGNRIQPEPSARTSFFWARCSFASWLSNGSKRLDQEERILSSEAFQRKIVFFVIMIDYLFKTKLNDIF